MHTISTEIIKEHTFPQTIYDILALVMTLCQVRRSDKDWEAMGTPMTSFHGWGRLNTESGTSNRLWSSVPCFYSSQIPFEVYLCDIKWTQNLWGFQQKILISYSWFVLTAGLLRLSSRLRAHSPWTQADAAAFMGSSVHPCGRGRREHALAENPLLGSDSAPHSRLIR